MKRSRPLTAREWRKKVREWLAARADDRPNAALLRRVRYELDTYLRCASVGSTRHARAILHVVTIEGPLDRRLREYLKAARLRYEADHQGHRRLERALLLLESRGGTSRDRRAAMTDDARIEAEELYASYVADAHSHGKERSAVKYAISKTAEALGVSESSIRQSRQKTRAAS